MAKRAVIGAQPKIVLNQEAQTSLYKQLYERLRAQILTGQLEAGVRLPSTRRLASELGVSRNTAALAYELLLLEGYIESRVGDGSRVARLQPESLSNVSGSARKLFATGSSGQAAANQTSQRQLPNTGRRLEELQTANQAGAGAGLFRIGEPDITHFPFAIWSKLVAKHARQSLPAASLYQDPAGYTPLLQAIAAHIGVTRGVHCSPEQIILTAGAQAALDLAARVLLKPGSLVWVENPGYLGARGALVAAGATLVPVSVDQEGVDIEAGRQTGPEARMAVVTPSHQFPTGVTMSLGRRLALLDWARIAQGWVVEDDYDSDYRYSGRPLEALQGLDSSGRVMYIGTFSKALFPALRLGYLVAPEALLPRLIAARSFIDVHPPMLEQMALAEFIAGGHFARHLRRMRVLYQERRDALAAILKRELGDSLDIALPQAGMHLVAWLPQGIDGHTVAQRAAAAGVYIRPVSHYSLGPLPRDGLVLGFANTPAESMPGGVRTLALALRA